LQTIGQSNDPYIAPGSQKAIAEVLAMIDADLPLAPHRPCPVLEREEWLFESATEFIEALEKYYAERGTEIKRKNHS
jgi:hypothetical protein